MAMSEAIRVLEHPVYPVPSQGQWEADPFQAQAYIEKRNLRIELENSDPYYYGYRPGVWERVEEQIARGFREILILGGNRASKSEYGSFKTIETLLRSEKRRVWAMQTTDANSIEMQQASVWRYVPSELKELKKGRVTNIAYTQKNGFSENKFIFPNGSECIFRNYAQDITVIEGGDCDLIWCDELVPLSWIETLRYRLITRGGLLLITFTPVEGYSPAIKEFLDGARVVEEEEAELLGGQRMPRVQHCVRRGACVVYFWTSDNPFGGYRNACKTLEGAPRSEIKTRAYGVPTKALGARFPKFREGTHVFEPEKLPLKGTNYVFCDPASRRNWFLIWVRVDPAGRHWVYREWPMEGEYIPGIGDPGPWAEPDGRRADGRAGSAQSSFGWGISRYLEEIRRLESGGSEEADKESKVSGEEVLERWMDSRFGNTPTNAADAATTLLEECASLGMPFSPAPNDTLEEGVSLINSMLDFDLEKGRSPTLFISSRCRALIFALKVWTGKDEKTGASKDPIDCLRWLAVAGLEDAGSELTLVRPMGY
jgi:hypothetical protein